MPKFFKTKLIIFFLIAVFLSTSGLACKTQSQELIQASQPVTIKVWRTWDDAGDFNAIFSAYHTLHPNVNIEYRKFRYEEYEDYLLNALAEDRGPDIMSLHNTWLRKYEDKIMPMPASVKVAYTETQGTIKKEVVTVLRENRMYTPKDIRNNFLDLVSQDVIFANQNGEQIMGVPMSVDTLVMFYNKDLFNNAGIALPPTTWTEFQSSIKKLTKINAEGELLQSGAAIGRSDNVPRSFDILSLLMMQNRTNMFDTRGAVAFNQAVEGLEVPPGYGALTFYTDFADPLKEVYTWNEQMPDAVEAFISGQTAVLFGYSYHLEQIKAQAPKMNLGIAPVPQIEGNDQVNYGSYWVESVSNKTKYSDEAWDLIKFMTQPDQVKLYLENTQKPTALRALINDQLEDEFLGPFAGQLLTAKSWYRGYNPGEAENVFADMITAIHNEIEINEIMRLGVQRMQQTMYKTPY